MEKLLVLTHVDESGVALTKASLEAVAAGVEFAGASGAALSIGIVGAETGTAANSVAGASARVLTVSGEAFAQARYASDAAACEALCRAAEATLVFAPSSSRFARVIPGVAYRLGGFADTHITALGAGKTLEASRWFYRQRVEAMIRRESRPWFLLLDAGTRAPFAAAAGQVQAETVAVSLPQLRSQVTGIVAPKQDEQTIRPEAKMLFVAGAGWTKKQADGQAHVAEAGSLILNFLRSADASLGSSKSLVDQSSENQQVLSFLTHMNQVGQTGATPRHAKGLATCCHGEEPHVVGWRFINDRRAISLDPNCGWARGKADVVYVADAFKVMASVNALLAENKQ
ncbi:MAG: electron transfer flavoprotein subunit alpha [Acidobacteria bacterium]|nr:MAG: electron transfer flavoprotein subunit alpha [Acidobacteriota bacterium]